jgi:hypothetical protein
MGSPLDRAVDLLVYAPLGLALTAKDELPKLVEKGRQRSTAQLTMARMIGQFVVTQGQKELTDRLTAFVGSRPSPPPPSSPPPAEPQPAEPAVVHTSGSNGANGQSRSAAPSPPVDALAIHGYDSLSAPQVVQRLAGLSVPELEAVGSYEETHRGRRTILSKVAMLQAERA